MPALLRQLPPREKPTAIEEGLPAEPFPLPLEVALELGGLLCRPQGLSVRLLHVEHDVEHLQKLHGSGLSSDLLGANLISLSILLSWQ